MIHQLLALGLQPGDRIAIQKKVDSDWIDLFFAAMKLNLSISPLPLKAPAPPFLQRLKPKIWIDSEGRFHHFNKSCRLKETSPSILLFTSGSTNEPKIAVFRFDQLLESAKSVVEALSIGPNDCLYLSLPMHHVGGIGILLRSFVSGAKITFLENDPTITILSQVPTQLYRAWPIHPCLRCIMLGGAPIPDIPEKLPIYATYGLTEMGSTVLLKKHPPNIHGQWHLGFPLPHAKMKLANDGEILVQGKSLFEGYLVDDEIQAPDEWFQTKDLGSFCEKTGFAIVGRKDNLFISGGENIQPEEIEKHLLTHPEILNAIVSAKKDPEFGMRPVACIESIRPIKLENLQAFLKNILPKHKIPIALYELPKTDFKIKRKEIFEMVNHS